jgi:hypothetical protein
MVYATTRADHTRFGIPEIMVRPMSFAASFLPVSSVALGSVAILSAYVYAVLHGDVQPGLTNLPDITHCVLKMPERGLFLFLFMPACSLQAGSWLVGSGDSSTVATLGVTACLLLILGEAMLDAHPNWTLRERSAAAAAHGRRMRMRAPFVWGCVCVSRALGTGAATDDHSAPLSSSQTRSALPASSCYPWWRRTCAHGATPVRPRRSCAQSDGLR